MKWFMNLSTGAKLALGFVTMMALFSFVIFIAYTRITALEDSQRRIHEVEFTNVENMWEIRMQENAMRADMLAIVTGSSPEERQNWFADLKDRGTTARGDMQALLDRKGQDAGFLNDLQKLMAMSEADTDMRERQIIPLLNANQDAAARSLILGVGYQRLLQMRAIWRRLGKQAQVNVDAAVQQSDMDAQWSLQILGVVGALALVLGGLMSVFFNRIIVVPLREVAGAAAKVASGDLTVQVSSMPRRDEVGALTQTFGQMVTNLQDVNRGITQGVNVLTASAGEILASTTQLAASAAQTATAVTETTATIEEIRQTAQLASQKARQVADSAQTAVGVAQEGRKSTEEASAGMQKIREQMEAIGEGMMRLSEQSQAVGQIISSVDDLAQQSNLLAVNAAIEAAKAGEQGKGFAVVAQEVKSLADQSKQATMQIRSILTDIQRATSAAVMATEQGSKAVELGVAQAEQAGEAILLLAESVEEAAQAATQISASSQQQLVGLDQVGQAMESIKQASIQNVGGARQLEESARGLTALGHSLKDGVAQFKL